MFLFCVYIDLNIRTAKKRTGPIINQVNLKLGQKLALLDKAENDLKKYGDQGGCYPPKQITPNNGTLLTQEKGGLLQISSDGDDQRIFSGRKIWQVSFWVA